jgi:hypothetical protein
VEGEREGEGGREEERSNNIQFYHLHQVCRGIPNNIAVIGVIKRKKGILE